MKTVLAGNVKSRGVKSVTKVTAAPPGRRKKIPGKEVEGNLVELANIADKVEQLFYSDILIGMMVFCVFMAQAIHIWKS